MKRSPLQINIFFVTSLCACALGVLFPQVGLAYFSDDASAGGATFGAATLSADATLSASSIDISATSPNAITLSTSQTSNLAVQYRMSATSTPSCVSNFYKGIDVHATQGATIYDGSLSNFVVTSQTLGTWNITFSASSSLSVNANDSCAISFVTTFWQQNFQTPTGGGFTQTVTQPFIVNALQAIGTPITPSVVLNEIYPNEDNTLIAPLNQEWVELYNTTNAPIDVEGWSLGEFAGNSAIETLHTISASNTCGPGKKIGYARPYNGTSTVIAPLGLMVIEFCAQNRLNNNGDTVDLYNSVSSPIDSYSYPATTKGKSDARIPDGGPWVDPIPTPGMPNELTTASSTVDVLMPFVQGIDTSTASSTSTSTPPDFVLRGLASSSTSTVATTSSATSLTTASSLQTTFATDSDPTPSDEEHDAINTDTSNTASTTPALQKTPQLNAASTDPVSPADTTKQGVADLPPITPQDTPPANVSSTNSL